MEANCKANARLGYLLSISLSCWQQMTEKIWTKVIKSTLNFIFNI